LARLFGTDGVRGIVGQGMNDNFAFRLAYAAGRVLQSDNSGGAVLIGRDTRASGESLEKAATAGLCAAGMEVWLAGVMTTPGVAFLTAALGARAGLVISASHNPHDYNGLKLLDPSGSKLSDAQETAVEEVYHALLENPKPNVKTGCSSSVADRQQDYVDHLRSLADGDLTGLKLVLDCANGAAGHLAPELFRTAGAQVEVINANPDGRNINLRCGSLHPASLRHYVLRTHADAGLAFDGDADRAILVDERGGLIDGDHILAIMARALVAAGKLPGNLVVGTAMSSLGLEISLREANCQLIRAPVGDRYVYEMMRDAGARLGGEPSGHVIFLDHAITGDGMLTGLALLKNLVQSGQSLSQLAVVLPRLPRVALDLPVHDKHSWEHDPRITDLIRKLQEDLGQEGRLVVRTSGTEPLVRIMVEGVDADLIAASASRVADALKNRYGS
jgi:phosphoglucosamine mutase